MGWISRGGKTEEERQGLVRRYRRWEQELKPRVREESKAQVGEVHLLLSGCQLKKQDRVIQCRHRAI